MRYIKNLGKDAWRDRDRESERERKNDDLRKEMGNTYTKGQGRIPRSKPEHKERGRKEKEEWYHQMKVKRSLNTQ